jgi:hypothetical protein
MAAAKENDGGSGIVLGVGTIAQRGSQTVSALRAAIRWARPNSMIAVPRCPGFCVTPYKLCPSRTVGTFAGTPIENSSDRLAAREHTIIRRLLASRTLGNPEKR